MFDEGVEYWYRVNDDTQFATKNWIRDLTSSLRQFDPPNLGVVGPTCKQGNTAILTYDFVHRTHQEVHGYQYTPSIENWWCDDWITRVYGNSRTLKLPKQEVNHMLTGSRYKVASSSQGKSIPGVVLPTELKNGACNIDRWLKARPEFA